jgi:hypothetical protein
VQGVGQVLRFLKHGPHKGLSIVSGFLCAVKIPGNASIIGSISLQSKIKNGVNYLIFSYDRAFVYTRHA